MARILFKGMGSAGGASRSDSDGVEASVGRSGLDSVVTVVTMVLVVFVDLNPGAAAEGEHS